jgi:hypothetical protein
MANYPVKRDKTVTPTVSTNQEIEGQGSVPFVQPQEFAVPAAPGKNTRMKVRGFGGQLRATTFTLR